MFVDHFLYWVVGYQLFEVFGYIYHIFYFSFYTGTVTGFNRLLSIKEKKEKRVGCWSYRYVCALSFGYCPTVLTSKGSIFLRHPGLPRSSGPTGILLRENLLVLPGEEKVPVCGSFLLSGLQVSLGGGSGPANIHTTTIYLLNIYICRFT